VIRFIKNSFFFACLGCVGCTQTRDTGTLPFFNRPDFTPEWIDVNSPEFNRIHTIPSFSFTDQDGREITEKTVAGKIYVANFMFTSCVSICPLMTANMNRLQAKFLNDPDVILLSHSVLPDADSVATLKKYAERKGINSTKWHLLTGNRDSIYAIAKKQYFAGDSIGFYGNQRDFLHTENFILVDRHRRIRGVYNGTVWFEMERIIEDIDILKEEN
jgi:protein SCO1